MKLTAFAAIIFLLLPSCEKSGRVKNNEISVLKSIALVKDSPGSTESAAIESLATWGCLVSSYLDPKKLTAKDYSVLSDKSKRTIIQDCETAECTRLYLINSDGSIDSYMELIGCGMINGYPRVMKIERDASGTAFLKFKSEITPPGAWHFKN